MKPERIEELLKIGLSREVPEQMRGRILGRVTDELSRRRRRFWSVPRLAFTAVLIAAVIITGFCKISDARRCSRLQAMVARPADAQIAALLVQAR
jgi:hypothetical protein